MNCGTCKWYEPYQGVCCFGDSPHCADFVDAHDACDCWVQKPMTNAERIRAMSDEELAEEMCGHAIDTICDIVCDRECCAGTEDGCIAKLLDWLKQPAEVE